MAKIIFESLENIFDHLVRPFWPIFFWEKFEFFVATMVNGRQPPRKNCIVNLHVKHEKYMCMDKYST